MNIMNMKKRIFALILTGLFIFAVAGRSGDDNGENSNADPLVIPDYITIQGEVFSTSLTELDLRDRGLTNSDIEPLKYMVNLRGLQLGGNEITDISSLAGLTNLTELILSNNKINNISPLAGLTGLTWLLLPTNQIVDINPLTELTNLIFLNLNVNQITNISPLAGLTNLTLGLGLNFNEISDISPLFGLNNLTGIGLEGNPITSEQIEELREALPNTQIDH